MHWKLSPATAQFPKSGPGGGCASRVTKSALFPAEGTPGLDERVHCIAVFNALRLLLLKKKSLKRMTVEKVTGLWRCTARSRSSLPSRACLPLWKIFPFISMAKARQGLQGSPSREQRLSGLHCARASSVAGVLERCGPAPQRLQRPGGGAHADRRDANSDAPAAAG